ncbi:hypothetical protein GCM10007160_05100 [Litchfieldella qijiaojingensis]|uniref:DUF3307 domain-containing protein n=1 Tax=Litchfieldella qijiaojingensis TaxID=980347 RepID=A0ABQ2YFV1_9GAMM|nr:DUF3307 domain-containing protein [Halomonas qijiaojingensis]GGX80871.1 hypothetical protein GCM10007160_05100 [Halomonas qijiaojingensis]
MNVELSLLPGLILAHLVGDFLLQPGRWVEARYRFKERSRQLYLHASIHGLLTLSVLMIASLATPSRGNLPLAVAGAVLVATSHALIDLGKAYLSPQRLRWFLLDQSLHLLILVGLWLAWLGSWQPLAGIWTWLVTPPVLVMAVAYLLVTRPLSIAIALAMRRWSDDIANPGTLTAAGARIGMLERFLVLTLVLLDQMTAIGFLLAAKSVLRFGELRGAQDRKLTEYVLLGTLLSVSSAMVLGLLVRTLLLEG